MLVKASIKIGAIGGGGVCAANWRASSGPPAGNESIRVPLTAQGMYNMVSLARKCHYFWPKHVRCVGGVRFKSSRRLRRRTTLGHLVAASRRELPLFSENEVSRCQPDLWAVAYFVVSHRGESGLERCDTPNMDTRFPF